MKALKVISLALAVFFAFGWIERTVFWVPEPSAIQKQNSVKDEPKTGVVDQSENVAALRGSYQYSGVLQGRFVEHPYHIRYTFHGGGRLTKEIIIGVVGAQRRYRSDAKFTVEGHTLRYTQTAGDVEDLIPESGEDIAVLGTGKEASLYAFQWGVSLSPNL